MSLLLFGLVVAALDLAPPEGALAAAERDLVERQLALVAARDGSSAALSVWAAIAEAHPRIAVAVDHNCAPGSAVRSVDGPCLAVTDTPHQNRFLEGLWLLAPPLLVGAAVSAAAALLISRRLTQPIRTVNAALQRLASGDLDTRIGPALRHSSRELSRLGDAFDHAADRLQKLSDGQRRLFNDLSHEIRSPLARLRAAVGLLEVSPDRMVEMLRQIETDIVRLDKLLRDILTLARFDSADARPAFARLDLIEILEPILSDANFEGQPRGVVISYAGPARLEFSGIAELLHRAIKNVIRNALAHSPEGGKVTVFAKKDGTDMTIDIADQGPGVPDKEKRRIFDPFIRLHTPSGQGGSGLGLAIASRAIAAHDGNIELIDNEPCGLRVRLVLPYLPRATSSDRVGGTVRGNDLKLS
ncbi:MAG: ATP-binding protein [Pseudorhodobacter sp.]|nr:ATP-binding protein [Pseudorhodobacter sp.]